MQSEPVQYADEPAAAAPTDEDSPSLAADAAMANAAPDSGSEQSDRAEQHGGPHDSGDGDDDEGSGLRLHVSIDEKLAIAQAASERVFALLGAGLPEIEVSVEDDQIIVRLRGLPASLQPTGDTRILESIQFILNKAVNKLALKRSRLSLDAEGFRRRRPDGFEKLALELAERVVALGKAIAIGPLGQADMRLLGQQLAHTAGVSVHADGPHDRRRLVVAPAVARGDSPAAAQPSDEGERSGEDGMPRKHRRRRH